MDSRDCAETVHFEQITFSASWHFKVPRSRIQEVIYPSNILACKFTLCVDGVQASVSTTQVSVEGLL